MKETYFVTLTKTHKSFEECVRLAADIASFMRDKDADLWVTMPELSNYDERRFTFDEVFGDNLYYDAYGYAKISLIAGIADIFTIRTGNSRTPNRVSNHLPLVIDGEEIKFRLNDSNSISFEQISARRNVFQ